MKGEDLVAALKGAAEILGQGAIEHRCLRCRARIEDAQVHCTGCGALLRFACPRCKSPCCQGHDYCAACGFRLTQEAVADSVALTARAEEEQRSHAIDLLELFTELEKVGEQRCLKFRARRRDTGEPRFLKKATGGEGAELLENEAAVLSALSHPNLVRLHQAHRHREQILLELEQVQTAELRFPLSIERLCRIMSQVAQGLAALHERGWVHGDVKPENVLLRGGPESRRDEVALCDLEFAQAPGPSRFKAMTPLFSAPEQIVGDHIDFRADVYAFGVVFYLWFFYDRLPSILDAESSAYRTMGRILGSVPYMAGTPLTEATMLEEMPMRRQDARRQWTGYPTSEEEVLGAKYHFAAELERITNVNRRLDLTGDILQLVSDTTEIDRAKRPADGRALVQRMELLLKKVGEAPLA